MLRYLWHALAAFGDSSVLLPCGVLIALVLFPRIPTRRLCAAWLTLLIGTGAIVAATKVLYMGWGFGLASVDFTGLSGHAALSFLVWPVTFFLFFGQARKARALAAAAGIALAAAIAVSRLQTHAHSASEVVLGGILGGGISSFYLLHYRRVLQTVAPRRWLAVILAVPLVIGYLHAAPTESILAALARALSGHSYVYTRQDLHSSAFPGLPRVLSAGLSTSTRPAVVNVPSHGLDRGRGTRVTDSSLGVRPGEHAEDFVRAPQPSTDGPSMVDGSSTLSASSAVSTPSEMQISRTVRFSLRAFWASLAARS